ncbi:SGNH/GDSL hydrolase family protein [Thermoactinospora rubra]|uniref:SGNH/GDSL hydrolase family protein n=1 Tax=Thermoactinospora rubra TaxID=1088767 RepID=UPI00117DBA84|nr:SGNH/GDSL hydrolase family protein [Thermoactinospora rubra]
MGILPHGRGTESGRATLDGARGARRRTFEAVVAGALGVVLALAGLGLGLFDTVACKAMDVACEERGTPPPLPRWRELTPMEAALRGAYVALGDSYSSGEGVYDEKDPPVDRGAGLCHRSRGSYVPLVAKAFRFSGGWGFWACAGATTEQLLRGQHGHRPQIDRVPSHASLVTVSVGGNDAGFAEVLKACIVRFPWTSACTDQEPQVLGRIERLGASLREVLLSIRARAPQARIIVLGYPRLFPERPAGDVDNLYPGDQRWLNQVARRLNDELAAVVARVDRAITAVGGPGSAEFVDAYDAFDGHEIGTAQPYANGLDVDVERLKVLPRSYHPTEAGYRRFGELVTAQIARGPDRPLRNLVQEAPATR